MVGISEALSQPAIAGLAGAFMYAGPRWIACFTAARANGTSSLVCTLDLFVCLAVGSLGAATLLPLVLTYVKLKGHDMSVSTLIGLFANPVSPTLTKIAPNLLGTVLDGMKSIKGDGK